jgi:uncharacterized membrane protein (DUF2068 family)
MGKLHHKFGLRTVAVVEAVKGAAVIALCIILLSLLHADLDSVVDHLTDFLRLNPDSRVADWFYDLADRTTGRGIWTAVSVGVVYASGRFVEAYGLWHELQWAEWFAVISGAVYVPFELFAAIEHPQWFRFLLLNGNLIVVLYIVWILIENRREREDEMAASYAAIHDDEPGPPALKAGNASGHPSEDRPPESHPSENKQAAGD